MFVGTQTTMLVAFMVIMVITLACLRSFDKAFQLLKNTAVNAGTGSDGGSFRVSKSSKSKSSSVSSEMKKSCALDKTPSPSAECSLKTAVYFRLSI